MSDSLLVSLIIRTDGRRPALLAQAIASIQTQTYRPIELIVVEDGCPGATKDAITSVAPSLDIRILPLEKAGRSRAGNAGLASTRGEFIGFLDDDDLLMRHHVETLIRQHGIAEIGATYAWAWEATTFDLAQGQMPVREKKRTLVKPGPLTPATLFMRNLVPIQAVLFRRSLYERYGGFDESLDYLEDWDLWLRYVAVARFVEIPEATSIYRTPAEPAALISRAQAHGRSFDAVRRHILTRVECKAHRSDTGKRPMTSVVIVNYNAGEHLTRCLMTLGRQTRDDFEAIVVDNASSDGSFERAIEAVRDPRMRYFALPINTGFAAANNIAATIARGDWLATLNPDAFPEPGWLTALLAAAQRHPDATMFGSTQLDDRDPTRLDGAGDCYLFSGIPWRGGYGHPVRDLLAEVEVFSPCAAAALYRLDGFRALGGFDERFFCYVEDVDLAYRWRLSGARAIQVSAAAVRHVGGASSQGPTSKIARYHGTRNMAWAFLKNTPAPLLWPLLPVHLAALMILLIKSLTRGDGHTIARALLDALRGVPATLHARKAVQATRRVSVRRIANALTWNVGRYLRRDPPLA